MAGYVLGNGVVLGLGDLPCCLFFFSELELVGRWR